MKCCRWCVLCVFKQRTAYEMRISDWSSDVCSSDLHLRTLDELALALLAGVGLGHDVDRRAGELRGETNILAAAADGEAELIVGNNHFDPVLLLVDDDAGDRRRLKRVDYRSAERRVGKEWVSTCRSRG